MIIRPLRTAGELTRAEDLQRRIWGFPEREIIPLNELAVLRKHGAFVFGAFAKGRMISFCYGQPAWRGGRAYHYSRILGVLPEYQGKGIAYRMKLHQRKHVLNQGLDLVCWTFDPLQGPNASLNIGKLGCIAREYSVNLYPESRSRFNRGIGSDRFTAEWHIRSSHVRRVLEGRRRPASPEEHGLALDVALDRGGRPVPRGVRAVRGRGAAVEIPADVEALKEEAPALARRWREATRRAFLGLFARGYVVYGFGRFDGGGRTRPLYLLEKGFRTG